MTRSPFSRSISPSPKIRLTHSLVTYILLYACQSLTPAAQLQTRIQAMEMMCYRKILGISYKHRVTNEDVPAKIQQAIRPHENLLDHRKERQPAVVWPLLPLIRSGKTTWKGTVKGRRKQAGRKKMGRQHQGLEFPRGNRKNGGIWLPNHLWCLDDPDDDDDDDDGVEKFKSIFFQHYVHSIVCITCITDTDKVL